MKTTCKHALKYLCDKFGVDNELTTTKKLDKLGKTCDFIDSLTIEDYQNMFGKNVSFDRDNITGVVSGLNVNMSKYAILIMIETTLKTNKRNYKLDSRTKTLYGKINQIANRIKDGETIKQLKSKYKKEYDKLVKASHTNGYECSAVDLSVTDYRIIENFEKIILQQVSLNN